MKRSLGRSVLGRFLCLVPVFGLASLGRCQEKAAVPSLSEFQQRQVAEYTPLLVAALEQRQRVDRKTLFEKVIKPIAFINKRDFENNKAFVVKLAQKATEINEKDPAKAAEYAAVARAYKRYAECNLAIVNAYDAGDSSKVNAALKALVDAQKEVARVMGKPVQRDWFTPEEAECYIISQRGRQRQASKG